MAPVDRSINYIEFPLNDNEGTKVFYETVFGWKFTDWGSDYISFEGAGIDGGFNGLDNAKAGAPGILVVLYADDLEATLERVRYAGAEILQEIYDFPGGRRFHFRDPNGNEMAIWSADEKAGPA